MGRRLGFRGMLRGIESELEWSTERAPGTSDRASTRPVKPHPAFWPNGFRAPFADSCSDRGHCLTGPRFVDLGA